eukprot:snap_masked-scaffold_4-processed-gene-7.43-mRNA-1 protein AED:0.18 eAED:0.19 QI:0/-1/0/1/-1/1/1/0/302
MDTFKFDPADSNSHDCVRLTTPEGASISISLFGATIYSILSSDNEELLFLSKNSKKQPPKPIRGGIPVVFPKFGDGLVETDLPSHGFARRCVWKLKHHELKEEEKLLQFSLELNDQMLLEQFPAYSEAWKYKFELTLEGALSYDGKKFINALKVKNTGNDFFEFQALLHTYYLLDNVAATVVNGLDGVGYVDKTDGNKEKTQIRGLKIEKETDWIFSPGLIDKVVEIQSGAKNIKLTITVQNGVPDSGDVVVWNPYAEKAKGMGDFGDEEYHNMICVEPGYVKKNVILEPRRTFTLKQTIEA